MTTAHGPTVGRRRLRFALRRAREAADLTQEQVATAMDWSLSKLIRIEAGQVSISTNDLKALITLYRLDDPKETSGLLELARVSRQRPWWSGYKDILSPQFSAYIGLEAEASLIRYFHTLLAPGLLQTAAYMQAIVKATAPSDPSSDELDAIVQLRLTRQSEVLGRSDAPEILAVLDEAVVRRQVGSPQTMRDQLLHLVECAERPNLTIKILPFSVGAYPVMSGPFVILEFPTEEDSPAILLENNFSGDVLKGPDDVELYKRAFDKIWDLALSARESLQLLHKVADEFE
jgi:transcriptional regulator with XRE-family HTH domain